MTSKNIGVALDEIEDKFIAVAPKSISYRKERSFAAGILKNNSYLMNAAKNNPSSFQDAIINVASIGLSLNPAEKLAYLIPRNVKSSDNKWVTKVFLEPSYVGMLRLATDSGSVEWVQAALVYHKDNFTDHGPGNKPTHEYQAFAKDRGEFVGVYCTAKTSKGDYLTNMMTAEEVFSIRERSESWSRGKVGKKGPWESDFGQMAKKSVIRQAFKTWPSTDERRMSEAVGLSNENEGFEPITTSPELPKVSTDQKEYFDSLIVNSDGVEMFLFIGSIEDSVYQNLYHSFNKGEKGKYQKIVDSLFHAGREKINEYIESIQSAFFSGSDSEAKELLEELSDNAKEFVKNNVSMELNQFISQIN